jgi:phospholipase C
MLKLAVVITVLVLISQQSICEAKSSRIKHIIVLMMENRSFDNLLGWLKTDKNPKIDGLVGTESQPKDINDPSKGSITVNRHGYDVSPSDPKHGYDDIAIQMNKNQMNGFVYDSIKVGINEENPVSMFDMTTAPVINTLAQEFAVFDRWFCSIPSSTDPNRVSDPAVIFG